MTPLPALLLAAPSPIPFPSPSYRLTPLPHPQDTLPLKEKAEAAMAAAAGAGGAEGKGGAEAKGQQDDEARWGGGPQEGCGVRYAAGVYTCHCHIPAWGVPAAAPACTRILHVFRWPFGAVWACACSQPLGAGWTGSQTVARQDALLHSSNRGYTKRETVTNLCARSTMCRHRELSTYGTGPGQFGDVRCSDWCTLVLTA